jgi:hypothetical protein
METITVSVHLVAIVDDAGDIVDAYTYCSDYCAQTNAAYDGWNGCYDIDGPAVCHACWTCISG